MFILMTLEWKVFEIQNMIGFDWFVNSIQLALQFISNSNFEHRVTQIRFSLNSGSVSSGTGSSSVKLVDFVSASERVELADSLALNWVNSLL